MEDDRYTRITLRIPKDLHSKLQESADATSKSTNAEIVARLERSFTADKEIEQIAFEGGFEATQLKREIERLTALLQKTNENKVPQIPSVEAIADKVVEKLDRLILPFSQQALQKYLEIIERSPDGPDRKWWKEQFGYDPETLPVPQHGGPPVKSSNLKRSIKKSKSSNFG